MKRILKIGTLALATILLLIIFGSQGLKLYLAPPDITDLEITTIKGNELPQALNQRPEDNKYVEYDKRCLEVMTLFNGDNQYFTNNSNYYDFNHHLSAIKFMDIPGFEAIGTYEITADTLAGDMNPAIHVVHWSGKNSPTIIYHHGGSVVPDDENFKNFFPPQTRSDLNLIIIRSPYHKKSSTEIMEAGSDISKYMAMMATSVKLTEEVIQHLKNKGYENFQVAGVSLGGFISNRHHLAYNSANSYVPVIAGTAQGDLFFSSIENTLVSHISPLDKIKILNLLNFDDEWLLHDHSNVFPVLAEYDCINFIEIMGPSYGDMPIEVLNIGHLTTVTATDYIREKFLKHLYNN